MSKSDAGVEARKHVRGSSLLLVGRMISIAINFWVQVLIVRYLSKEGYGAFAYGYSIALLAARMTPLGTDRALSRFIPIYQEENKLGRIKGSLWIASLTIIVMGVLLIGLVISSKNVLSGTLVRDPLSLSVLLIIISLAPLYALENLLTNLLAVFGRVKSLFFRRHLLTPLLRLAAVCGLMAAGGDAVFLAAAYVVATLVGVLITAQILWRVMREDQLLAQLAQVKAEYPTRRLFGFGVPLLSSDVVFSFRTILVVVLLEFFHGTTGVAAFRAILPVAKLNQVVFDSFRMLYVPTASRLFARGAKHEISQLYWQSSAWIAVLTFPIFLISFSLAKPTAVLLFGETYASSGTVLSLVALGMYLNAAFGFNTLTLRVLDRVRTIVKIDMAAALMALVLNLALVPRFGPLGGAVVILLVMIGQNFAYQAALLMAGQLGRIPGPVARIHCAVMSLAVALLVLQTTMSPPFGVGLVLALIATAGLWWTCLKTLQIRDHFPELDRLLPRRSAVG
jgi:O-antigen/teichoic acid export membrane protein